MASVVQSRNDTAGRFLLYGILLLAFLPGSPAAARDNIRSDSAHGAAGFVSYSGGAVRFAVPAGWNVSEVPQGRELRLVLTPRTAPERNERLADGIWISYRHRPESSPPSAEQLARWCEERLRKELGPGVRLGAAKAVEVGGEPGAARVFRLSSSASSGRRVWGAHLVVWAGAGIVDMHLISPPELYEQRAASLAMLLDGMKLGTPGRPSSPPLPPQVAAATPALGSWKALESLLMLAPNGRIAIVFDHRRNYRLDSQGYLDYQKRVERLAGEFVARDDLLLVRWDDGSRTNYRWRTAAGRLYLTDHMGRVSELAAVFR